MNKFKLLVIVDDLRYALNEIYQGQLWKRAMQRDDLDVTFCEFCQLYEFIGRTQLFDSVYVALRVRNTIKHSHLLGSIVVNDNVIVQDYDPWCNFIDGNPWKNGYQTIVNHLNVKRFFVSSGCWCDRLNDLGYPAEHVKLGMLNQLINNVDHSLRRNSVEFRGSRHPTRVMGHESLVKAGISVQWLEPVKPYASFLNDLDRLFCWSHNESEPLIVDNEPVCSNWVWPKGLEVLHRGCFLFRDLQPEAERYDISSLPTAFLFQDLNEAVMMYDRLMSMSMNERNERMNSTISTLRNVDYYGDILNQIKNVGR